MAEEIIVTKRGKSLNVKGEVSMFSFSQNEFIIIYLPSLGISGYGETVDEAKESLEHTLTSFIENMHGLSMSKIEKEFLNLGWKKNHFFNKRFSHVTVKYNVLRKLRNVWSFQKFVFG